MCQDLKILEDVGTISPSSHCLSVSSPGAAPLALSLQYFRHTSEMLQAWLQATMMKPTLQ